MKRVIILLFSVFSLGLYSAEITLATTPTATMQSVNNVSYMTSGSTYAPTVYDVGSYSPAAQAPAARPYKAPPSTSGESDYDPKNPQFAPVGEGLLSLLLMAGIYLLVTIKRKQYISCNKNDV